MKLHSVNDIKKDLEKKNSRELIEYCLRLAKYKKKNKELNNLAFNLAAKQGNFISSVRKNKIDAASGVS